MRINPSSLVVFFLICTPVFVFGQSLQEKVLADYNQVVRSRTLTLEEIDPQTAKARIESLEAEDLTAPIAFQLGKLHFQTQQMAKALMYFEQVADLAEAEEMQRISRLFVAKLYGILKQEDVALAQINFAKAQWPSDPSVYLHEGEVYQKLQQWEQAKVAYKRGLAMAADSYLTKEKLLSYHVGNALAIGHTEGTTAGVAYAEAHVQPTSSRFHNYVLHKLGVSEADAAHTINSAQNLATAEVFPNPASSSVKFSWNGSTAFSYNVVNTNGHLVIAGEAASGVQEVDISRLSPGMYQVVLKRDGAQQATQFVKQ